MPRLAKEWRITCDTTTLEKVRKQEKFPYIVSLARAVNALYSVHSLLLDPPKIDTPEVVRNRINSYLFGSALLYETIVLIRKMKRVFADDETFQKGLRMILKNSTAQMLEQSHLKAARNHAVFHFIPEEFGKAVNKADAGECIFVAARGKKKRAMHYAYADIVAAEMLVGVSVEDPTFVSVLNSAGTDTVNLLVKVTEDAEDLIVEYLKAWGFKRD